MLAQVSSTAAAASCTGPNCGVGYSDFLRSYLIVVIFMVVAIGLVGAMLGVASILRPSRKRSGRYQGDKGLTYESGVNPVGNTWTQSQVRYYIFALLFVIFDVEAVFIFPWATRLETYDVFGLVEMLIFMSLLLLGLIYAWRKKVLQWL